MAETMHATAVLAGFHGVLIRGPSGSGKSRLAMDLIQRGGRLVADDSVHLAAREGRVLASAPTRIGGLIELRGRGLIEVPYERTCVIDIVVDIVSEEALERMPDDAQFTTTLLGIPLPRQPVTMAAGRSPQLIGAALEALGASANMGLRSAFVWG